MGLRAGHDQEGRPGPTSGGTGGNRDAGGFQTNCAEIRVTGPRSHPQTPPAPRNPESAAWALTSVPSARRHPGCGRFLALPPHCSRAVVSLSLCHRASHTPRR